MTTSMLIDYNNWDLSLTPGGDLATCATDQYAMAQDVATACRLFLGENWYNTAVGIRYFEDILGKFPAKSILSAYYRQAAFTVPGVIAAKVILNPIQGRILDGQVLFTDATGTQNNSVFFAGGTPYKPIVTDLVMSENLIMYKNLDMI